MAFQLTVMYNDIAELQIADGLKELLIDYGFTREKILRLQATQLAAILGIEDYIGKIIYNAAKPKSGKSMLLLGTNKSKARDVSKRFCLK